MDNSDKNGTQFLLMNMAESNILIMMYAVCVICVKSDYGTTVSDVNVETRQAHAVKTTTAILLTYIVWVKRR